MLLLFTSSFIKSFLTVHCRKPCKIGYKYLEDGTKVRYARGMNASGAVIPRPEILKERRKPRPTSRMSTKTLFYAHHMVIYISSYMLITCCFSWHINSLKVWSNSNSLCCRTSYWLNWSYVVFSPVLHSIRSLKSHFFSSQQHLTFGWHVACGYDVFEMLYMLGALSVPEGDL